MGEIIGNIACPQCREGGHDRTGNHLMLFADGGGYCNRCGYKQSSAGNANAFQLPVASPGNFPTPQSQDFRKWYAFSQTWRMIPPEILNKYGYQCAIDAKFDIEAVKHTMKHNGVVVAEKLRVCEGKTFSVINGTAGDKSIDLFGQDIFPSGGRRLCILGGQEDAMSMFTALEKYNIACVSVVLGENLKQIRDNIDYIKSFSNIYICGDDDEAGEKFIAQVASVLPGILHVKLPMKDANDMAQAGKVGDLTQIFFAAKPYRPPSIVSVSDIRNAINTPLELGLSYPWDSLSEMTYGCVDHTIISIGGGPSVGKSSLINAIKANLMFNHDEVIANFSIEETPEMSLRLLTGYLMKQKCHVPGQIYDVDKANEMIDKIEDRFLMYNPQQYNGEWRTIESSIRSMSSEGVKRFFIDPVTGLTGMLNSSETNDFINRMMSDLSKLVQELPITVYIVSHLNSPKKGTPHDRGGKAYASQFTGGKGIWRFSHEIYMAERNLHHSDETLRNTMLVRCGKHRVDGGKIGQVVRLFYDGETGILQDQTALGIPELEEKSSRENNGSAQLPVSYNPKVVTPSTVFAPTVLSDSVKLEDFDNWINTRQPDEKQSWETWKATATVEEVLEQYELNLFTDVSIDSVESELLTWISSNKDKENWMRWYGKSNDSERRLKWRTFCV